MHTQERKVRRYLGRMLRIVAFGLIGAICTVISTAACMLFSDVQPRVLTHYVYYPPPIHVSDQRGLGARVRIALLSSVEFTTRLPTDWHAREQLVQTVQAGGLGRADAIIEASAGFPMACAVGSGVFDLGKDVMTTRHQVYRYELPTGTKRFLPYAPVWTGLAIDVVAWALCAWAISIIARLPIAWIKHRRRRIGICAHCKYPVTGLIERCPECGTPFPMLK